MYYEYKFDIEFKYPKIIQTTRHVLGCPRSNYRFHI